MDVFTIEAVDMISLIKVIVEYEGEGQGKGWFLDKVVIKDLTHADKEFVFNCARYVSQISVVRFIGASGSVVRTRDFHLRGLRGSSPPATVSLSVTPRCLHSAGYGQSVDVNSLQAVMAAWLNASQRSDISVGMSRSARR